MISDEGRNTSEFFLHVKSESIKSEEDEDAMSDCTFEDNEP